MFQKSFRIDERWRLLLIKYEYSWAKGKDDEGKTNIVPIVFATKSWEFGSSWLLAVRLPAGDGCLVTVLLGEDSSTTLR